MVAGFDLFRPLLAGLIGAFAACVVAWVAAMVKARGKLSPVAGIQAGAAWSPSDSWVTNVAAVASLLTATWTQLSGVSPPLVTAKAASAMLILFISFAAAAGLAPVVYASCGLQAAPDETTNQGTVIGFLLAAFATLFAVGGELMALGMFIAKAMPAGPAQGILIVFVVASAVFVALYSIRTMYSVMTLDIVAPPAAAPAAGAPAAARPSLLVPGGRRSATL